MTSKRDTAAHIRWLMETEGETVKHNTTVINQRRYDVFEEMGEEARQDLRSRARAIKEDAIERLPELVEQLRESVEANGGTVYLAADAADANRHIADLVAEAGAESVVKSKSMTTEEIEVNDALESGGVEVHETDLGELVIQLAGEKPSHIVGPSLHKSKPEIAALFDEHFDLEEPLESAEELTAFARDYLAERIEEADVGMTGANFLVAETGSLALITNEGNARKVVESTDTHIAVAGIEKIVPSLTDLAPFFELVASSGNGQSITSYTSVFSPPVNTPPLDGADERAFHLVLIDNGRSEMREDEVLRETLYCVRCSACLNSCANFQHVGGHAFGGETYTGGIATGWEAGIHGQDSAATFNDLCTGCSRCVNQCPVEIDIPWINTAVRDRVNRTGDDAILDPLYAGLTPDIEDGGIDHQKRLFGNFETLARVGSALAPLSNWVGSLAPSRYLLERLAGVDRRRDLPTFQRETLREWFAARGGTHVREPTTDRRVVLYPDTATNYIDVERGKAAVAVLESLGVPVEIPAVPSSGRAPLSQGMVETARERAHAVDAALADHLDAGADVVVVEPSDLAMFRDDYEKFLPDASFDRLSSNSYDLLEYVYGLVVQEGVDPSALAGPDDTGGARVAYHSHCQQRTMGLEAHTVAVLEELGYEVQTSSAECCGMAGSFGYKSQYYELAMEVGESLGDQLSSLEYDHVLTSGTSCGEQVAAVLDDDPAHVAELIAPR
ncbi:LUD domain-containing protein [Natronobiforma cellulositropha]|uniref:LUD domain-containing protein n=1 Tax=Natronobiforma cellulositropha TaxID=1679076 RepID=UPI0021D5B60F|nr:LUD domain-containing protein [Natronobiforma cellulositropha]